MASGVRLLVVSVRPIQRTIMPEDNRHSHPFPARTLDLEVRRYVLSQALKDERAELALNWPRAVLGQADAVVGPHDPVAVFALTQASNGDDAGLLPAEGVLECIGQEFVD